MRLTQPKNTVGSYPKFSVIGDRYSGRFVSYEEDVEGTYGKETILTLRGGPDGGLMFIRCPAMLIRTLNTNRKHLREGLMMTLEFTAEHPTNRGAPAKQIDVDIADEADPASTKSDADEDAMPF